MTEKNQKEIWIRLDLPDIDSNEHFEISNYGRVKSFKTSRKGGKIIKGSFLSGYNIIIVQQNSGKKKTYFIHKLVAHYFLSKPSEDKEYVVHLDHDRKNNLFSNLKWVNKKEMFEHRKNDPEYNKKKVKNSKLTYEQVMKLKMRLEEVKEEEKVVFSKIAREFNITLTQLKRIERGENWSHVVVKSK